MIYKVLADSLQNKKRRLFTKAGQGARNENSSLVLSGRGRKSKQEEGPTLVCLVHPSMVASFPVP